MAEARIKQLFIRMREYAEYPLAEKGEPSEIFLKRHIYFH
jgi:hypothetical protein